MKIFKLACEAGDLRAADALMKILAETPELTVQTLNVMFLGDEYRGGISQYFGQYAKQKLGELTEEDPGEGPIKVWQVEGSYFGAPAVFCGAVGYNMLGMNAADAAVERFGRHFSDMETEWIKTLN